MKYIDLIDPTLLKESADKNVPFNVNHSLPRTVILPDMDLYYEFYRFVTNMACHPELEHKNTKQKKLRDVPMIVTYTPQEYEMVRCVAEKMGYKIEDISTSDSHEVPGGNTVSPVAKFNMSESHLDVMKSLFEHMLS